VALSDRVVVHSLPAADRRPSFLVLLWSSLQKFYSVPTWEALHNLTLDPYRFILRYPTIARSVWNSVLLSLGVCDPIMLLTSVICWITVKTKLPGRWLLDNLASLPMVFPGIVLGLSIMIFYLYFDIGIYGTMWILFVAYLTRFCPTAFATTRPRCCRFTRSSRIGGDERRLVGPHLRAHHPAAAEARHGGRVDLYRNRIDP
jgi:ABC-type Fe3+ transport system permease subunit